jgi:hypothetical protein
MSVSITYSAVIPIDGDLYRKHKAVLDACKAASVEIPDGTAVFFKQDPDTGYWLDGHEDATHRVTADGILHDIRDAVVGCLMDQGVAVIDLSKLPQGATKIRIVAG